jgi:hypothetical protein
MATEFVKRWGYMMAKEPTRPGIYRLERGGWLVRSRVSDPRERSKRHEVMRTVNEGNVQRAQAALDDLVREKRDELTGVKPQRQLWRDFAVSRVEAKILTGRIKSAKGRQKVESILRVHLLPEFGDIPCDELRAWKVEQWSNKVARMMKDGYESTRTLPGGKVLTRHIHLDADTANTWIALFKSLCGEMVRLLELDRDPSASLLPFDTSQDPTYTDESPNSLTPDRAREFLQKMHALFPQHYAMTLLGFVTGKRPSTLRPLRAAGDEPDVDWNEGFIRFRRSHTQGDEFMVGTKTGRHERVHLPEAVMVALRMHRAQVAEPPLSARGAPPLWWREPMAKSDLLFPGRDGGPRSPSCLDKPFDEVAKAMGLPFELSPGAMRRTCNDLCRAAKVDAVVTRSITGHLTDEMRIHYSTAQADEQRAALTKVVSLVEFRKVAT